MEESFILKELTIAFSQSVQSLSHIQFFVTTRTSACPAPLSSTISQSLLKFMSCELMMLSNHLIFCRPFSSYPHSFLASGFLPKTQLFTSGGQNTGASASAKYSAEYSSEYSGLISFRIDWFDLLAAQGTLKSLPHHYNSKALILWSSAFFMVQLLHL